jgi:polar amino acid transport system substrate-binding protein
MTSGTPHIGIVLTYPEESRQSFERRLTLKVQAKPREGVPRIGFIGLGNYAKSTLLPAVKAAGRTELTGVATATGLSANYAAGRFGFGFATTHAEEVIGDEDTDTVFIATRHDTHARLAVAALQRGKSVFCEKPLALTREELSDVLAAAQKSAGQLTVGFNRRYAPLLVEAKKALGGTCCRPVCMLYRVNAGATAPGSWLNGPEGGGRIVGEVCHFVDALAFLAGAPPVEVQAISAGGRADAVSILIRFADGSTGTIVYSALGDPAAPKEYLEILGERRVIRLDDFRRLTITAQGRTRVRRAGRQDKGQKALVAAFLARVGAGGAPPIPLAEIAAVTDATFAIEEALKSGGAVAVVRYE